MTFEARWRRLARAAHGAPKAPLPDLSEAMLERVLAAARAHSTPHPRAGFASIGRSWALRGSSWVAPAAALLALYLAAVPALARALTNVRGLSLSLRDAPRPPRAPALTLPAPPGLPHPPRPPETAALWGALRKEIQP
jgi:hypothetical protein